MFSRRPVQYLGLVLLIVACLVIIFLPTGAKPQPQVYTITLTSPKPLQALVAPGKDPVKEADTALNTEFKAGEKLPSGQLVVVPGPAGTKESLRATLEDQATTAGEANARIARIQRALSKPFPGVQVAPETYATLGDLPQKPLFALGEYAVFPPKKHNGGIFPAVKLGLDLQGGVNLVLQVRQALFTYKFDKKLGNDQDARDQFAAQIQDLLRTAPGSYNLQDVQVNMVPGAPDQFEVHTQAKDETEFKNQRKWMSEQLSRLPDTKVQEAREPQFFQPDVEASRNLGIGGAGNTALLERTVEIIRSRVDKLGVSEPLIQKQGTNRVVVQLPGVNDPQKAVEVVGKTAQLTIVLLPQGYTPRVVSDPNDPTKQDTIFTDPTGNPVPSGDVLKACIEASPDHRPIVTGADVKPNASVSYDEAQRPAVHFELQGEGSRRFAEATASNVGRTMPIFLDENCISAPTIQSAISGSGQISGGFKDMEEARALALLLNSGALPAPIDVVENRTVSATLGTDSLIKSVRAGGLGILAVALFMILWYRLPGMLANVALVIYCLLNLAVFILVGGTLTLPGIAGFLLAIAMSLDTNILVFERLKEEMVIQPTFHAALRAAFSRAWTAILDSHVTTLLAAIVLFFLGTGPVKGFALTLGIGVLLSLFSAISVTRLFMWSVAHYGETHRGAFASRLPDASSLALQRR